MREARTGAILKEGSWEEVGRRRQEQGMHKCSKEVGAARGAMVIMSTDWRGTWKIP